MHDISFPCEHPISAAVKSNDQLVCGICGSFFDLTALTQDVIYNPEYARSRHHNDPRVLALKKRGIREWLDLTGLTHWPLEGKHVMEFGYSAGAGLSVFNELGAIASGIEGYDAAQNLSPDLQTKCHLFTAPGPEDLRKITLLNKIDLWVFFDAFEHLDRHEQYVSWINMHSKDGAYCLLVLPQADSLSQKLLGKYWPHKIPDHKFHWSSTGLVEFMSKRDWRLKQRFFPVKYISPLMAWKHIEMLLRRLGIGYTCSTANWMNGFSVPFNLGEMGLLFKRAK